MTEYSCYDALNDPDCECPTLIFERDPEFAAVEYAEQLYHDDPTIREFEIIVIGDKRTRFLVRVDYEPVFSAVGIKDDEGDCSIGPDL